MDEMDYLVKNFLYPCNLKNNSSSKGLIFLKSSLVIYPNFPANIKQAFTSNNEPMDWLINLVKSFLVFLPLPSAIFKTIEIAARLIYEARPNNSSFGNFLTNL